MEERARIPVAPPVTNPLSSYWHDPKSHLANVIEPNATKGTQNYDYVVIGSGISGTMTAYNILNTWPDACVVMLEAREVCSGATGRNGGHTKAASYRSYTHHVQELGKEEALKIARLEYANIVETHRMAEDLGLNCESKLCNTVDLIYDKPTFEAGKMAIQMLRVDAEEQEKEEGNAAWYQIHEDIADIQGRFSVAAENSNPTIETKEKLAGAFEYLAGRIHAYRFTTGLLAECVKKGLQLCTNTPVHDIHPSINLDKENGSRWDVCTHHGIFTSKNVIIATNGYTPYIMKELQGAIVPMRGQITAQRPGTSTKLPAPLPTTYSFIYRDGYEYMIPRPLSDGGQHIVIGGGLVRLPQAGPSEYGTVDDSTLNTHISKYLNESLTGYFGAENWGEMSKEEASRRVVQEWTGIMGATTDGRPFVGEVPGKKGLWISAGFNGHGMVLCLKSAEALVKMMEAEGSKGKPEWFPKSFLITQERLGKCNFHGRTDMQVSE
ncbi:FAD dependent oxidoreductase [Alternaria rosae]|uniref:FAD dependent oxidoreductase n=1 Tax=Alternaria rosae TaxID=1187941 RepID=UPI001E8E470D|nr:FAD dependent oxidoreductase [Alternaria rosae]KAH6883026.1 FAD dependent oxidoreductase [Alternaria rosae]